MSRLIEKIKENKVKTLIIVASIFTVITMSGTTYALYAHNDLGNNTNYTAGLLDLTITEVSPLTLSNALPMPDTDGEASTPCTITITNTGNLTQKFNVLLENTTTSNSINTNYIKIKVDDDNARVLGSNNVLKSSITLGPTESITINIRLWLSLDTPTSEKNKTFTAKIKTVGKGININYPNLTTTLINLALGDYTNEDIPITETKNKDNTITYSANYLDNGDFLIVHNISTEQVDHDNISYHYYGEAPNNYISFNNEIWRIMGVTEEYTGSGYEYVTKIINLTPYDSTGLTWSGEDWPLADIQLSLNSTYYNSLSPQSKSQIQSVKWYLGTFSKDNFSDETVDYLYNTQRSSVVNTDYVSNWTGNIGLMYAEDYGYSSKIGDDYNDHNKKCYNIDLSKYEKINSDSKTENGCLNYNWINRSLVSIEHPNDYNDVDYRLLSYVLPSAKQSHGVAIQAGRLNTLLLDQIQNITNYFPVLYLKSSTKLTGGSGTSSDPYTIR